MNTNADFQMRLLKSSRPLGEGQGEGKPMKKTIATFALSDPVEAGLVESLARPAATSQVLQTLAQNSAVSGWSCSKKPLPNLPVSRFSTIRPFRPLHAR